MNARWLLLAAGCSGLAGCTVSAVSAGDDSRPMNECSSQQDCRSGQSCNGGMCQPLNGDLEALLIEITPPSDSTVPGLSFTMHVDDVPTSGGELKLPPVLGAKVTGNLHLPPRALCYPTLPQDGVPLPTAADGTLPVTVTLIPRERLLGVPQQLYITSSKFQLDVGSPTYLSYSFDIVVPLGEYDVYVVPPRGQSGCVVPPQLFRRQRIERDNTTLDYPASNSASLDLRLRWPSGNLSLDGWSADIIEPIDGRTISTEVVLGDPVAFDGRYVEYVVPLTYSTVSELTRGETGVEAAEDLLRLRPPAGSPLPAIFFDRSAIGLLADTSPIIDGFTRYPEPVTVVGQLVRADDGQPVVGDVRLVSTEIFGVDQGIFASYQTTIEVADRTGVFAVTMPPGKYRVLAVPSPSSDGANSGEGGLSALEAEWEIRALVSPQAGKVLELESESQIVGESSFEGAAIEASATPETVLPFETAFGAAPFAPRGQSAYVESGRFTLNVDPGRFDISVRAPESLGFGWYVKPGVQVGQPGQDLGRITPPVPSVVRGTTTAVSAKWDSESKQVVPVTNVLPFASVRAYAYLDEDYAYTRDPASAASVVRVAETRSDEAGAFRLLVPSSLAASK